MLALSYLHPVIAPTLGDLVDLPEVCGYFYDPKAPDGLFDALVAAERRAPKRFSHERNRVLHCRVFLGSSCRGYTYRISAKR